MRHPTTLRVLAKLSQLLHARGRPDEAEEIYLALALSDQPSAASPPSGTISPLYLPSISPPSPLHLPSISDQPSAASPPSGSEASPPKSALERARATNLSKAAERAAQAKPTKDEGGDNARPAKEGALEAAVA